MHNDRFQRLQDYLYALIALSRAASEMLTLDRLMHHVVAQVSRAMQIKHVKILKYRPNKADLLLEAGVGWKPGIVGRAVFSVDKFSPPGRAMQTGHAIISEDLPNDHEFKISDILRDHGIISVLNVPVIVNSSSWGVLEVDSDIACAFNQDDINFLTTAANIMGISISRDEIENRSTETSLIYIKARDQAEMLLQELQHRIKNNLQTIISFLSLQHRHAQSTDSRDRLSSVIDRVHAISLAHDQLDFKDKTGQVGFKEYLNALCANIDPQRKNIHIKVDADLDVVISIDRAVPAGLIVNELITNSIKHAFDEEGGTILVTLTVNIDQGEACLSVQDDGRGINQDVLIDIKVPASKDDRKNGLGLTLVKAFTQQLGGRIDQRQLERGMKTMVCFPLPL